MRIDIVLDSTDFPSIENRNDVIKLILNNMKNKFGRENDQIGVIFGRGFRFHSGDFEGNKEEIERYLNELYAVARRKFG